MTDHPRDSPSPLRPASSIWLLTNSRNFSSSAAVHRRWVPPVLPLLAFAWLLSGNVFGSLISASPATSSIFSAGPLLTDGRLAAASIFFVPAPTLTDEETPELPHTSVVRLAGGEDILLGAKCTACAGAAVYSATWQKWYRFPGQSPAPARPQ